MQRAIGLALLAAQEGDKAAHAKVVRGFGRGAGVLEGVEDLEGSTYRRVYTVRFAEAVYVLHAFQKKSKRGIETPKEEIERIRIRLRALEARHRVRDGEKEG